jgi:hypothetical protein
MPDSIRPDFANFDTGLTGISYQREAPPGIGRAAERPAPLPPSESPVSRELDTLFRRFEAPTSSQALLAKMQPPVTDGAMRPEVVASVVAELRDVIPLLRRKFRDEKGAKVQRKFEELMEEISKDRQLLDMYRRMLLRS